MEIDFLVIVALCEVQREQDTEERGGIHAACPWRKMGSVSDDEKTMWRVLFLARKSNLHAWNSL